MKKKEVLPEPRTIYPGSPLYRALESTQRIWILEDHICRNCSGGRILRCLNTGMSPGGDPLHRCADCGASCYSATAYDICWCGFSLRNQRGEGSYRCLPFSALKEKPYLLEAFRACGCEPGRSEVGIVMESDLLRLERSI